MINKGKLTTYLICFVWVYRKKYVKLGEKFGFEVSHPTHTPITKPTLRKPDAQQEICPPQWTGIRGLKHKGKWFITTMLLYTVGVP